MPTNPPSKSLPHHLPQLDALRGFAAALVFAFHWYWLSFTAASGNSHLIFFAKLLSPLGYGDCGVPIFFVLSGFCIHLATTRNSQPATRNFSPTQFLHRRLYRIFPAYLVWLTIFTLWHPTEPTLPNRSTILTHLLMLHNFDSSAFLKINSSFWSLAVEWQFYLAYPLLLLLRRFVGMPRATLLAFALSVTYCLALTLTGQNSPILVRCVLASYAQWTLGALLAERFVANKPILLPPKITLPLALPAALLLTARQDQWASLAWSLAAASVLDAWIRRPAFLPPRPLLFLGPFSYSFYLIHEPILEWMTTLLGRPDVPHIALIFTASLGITIVAAWATYRLIELPAVALSRGRAGRKPMARPLATGNSPLATAP